MKEPIAIALLEMRLVTRNAAVFVLLGALSALASGCAPLDITLNAENWTLTLQQMRCPKLVWEFIGINHKP